MEVGIIEDLAYNPDLTNELIVNNTLKYIL